VKGYEYEPGHFVTFDGAEAAPKENKPTKPAAKSAEIPRKKTAGA
jgi:hypothetical protein